MFAVTALALLAAGGDALWAAPSIRLEYADVPVALRAANDSGVEVRGCKVEWAIRWDRDRHFTEIAMVDLPAKGEVKVSDCHDWWNPNWSKTMDVTVTLRGPDRVVLAEEAYEGIFRFVPRQGIATDGWTATASRGGNPAAAFDSNGDTRWDTGGNQKSGDWYMLDMGRPQRMAGLIIDARGSANDYPSGFSVYVSEDGTKWTCLREAVDGEALNQGGRITLAFDAVTARYVDLELTRPHGDSWFWSIHELSVLPAK